MANNVPLKKAAIVVTLAFLATAGATSTTGAQSLMSVPLTGQRVRPIEPETLFHTLFDDFVDEHDGTTYVQTGDIPAMWLRDSSSQTVPYIRFQQDFPVLCLLFTGVIERNALNVLVDPYANAFMSNYHVWERKWEVDSLGWTVGTLYIYWHATGNAKVFTPTVHRALRQIVDTYRCEQLHPTCSRYRYPYHVYTDDRYNPNTNLIWGAFRPSDDAVQYRFNIPQNALAAVALREIAEIARDAYHDVNLANEAASMSAQIQVGIERYGLVWSTAHKRWMYVYETDGYDRYNFMDDANIPNLTALPAMSWCSSYDWTYLSTRAFTLSKNNPWYFTGTYAAGLGSPHTPYDFVWPLGIIARALTATSTSEVAESITTLAETDSKDGLIHESFYPNGYWRFTRSDFGWANAIFAELLFRTVAGFPVTSFVGDDATMTPFERMTPTPTLVNEYAQIENTGTILNSLSLLLSQRSALH